MTIRMDETKGPALRTYSGRTVYPYAPNLDDLNLRDAVFQLAHTNRFNGALGTLSVLTHLVNCARLAEHLTDTGVCFADPAVALLHDAHEYILGDSVRPVKVGLGAPYHEAEALWESAVYTKYIGKARMAKYYGEAGADPHVKVVDNGCLYLEFRDFGGGGGGLDYAPFDPETLGDFYYVQFDTPKQAMVAFERRCREYGLLRLDELGVN